MSLTLSPSPTFVELPDETFDPCPNVPTAQQFQTLDTDSQFAVVRNEQFYGYYANGQTVVLPVSPADGYEYSREELFYEWSLYSSSSATGFSPGVPTPPTTGAPSGQGQLLGVGMWVDQTTGLVTCITSYYKTSQQVTSDGVLCVITHAQRSR
jgi:hypothetical protein